MSRYLMVMWSGGGAVPPQLAVAKRLLRAGHDVTVLGPRSLQEAVTSAAAAFEPYRRAPEHDLSDPEQDLLRDWEARGPAAFARMRDNVMHGTAETICADVLDIVDSAEPDVIVTDYVLLGSYLAAEKARIPLAALLHTIFTLPRPGLPPVGLGLTPSRSRVAALRNALLKKLQLRFYNARLDDLNALRADLGLPPADNVQGIITGAHRLLLLTSPAFDYPGPIPANACWVGAITDPDRPAPRLRHAVDPHRERPRVMVSLSTTFQRQLPVLERAIDALSDLPVDAVVTTGPAVDRSDLPSPPNVQLLAWAPHDELMSSIDLVITHAGHGTVTTALRHGVPVLSLPMGRDQRDVAARVVWHGAGVSTAPTTSAKKLRQIVADALVDPGFRKAAQRLASDMARDDPNAAVSELERLATSGSGLAGSRVQDDPAAKHR